MPPIDAAVIDAYLATGADGATTTEKGRALEDLICYLFGLVPGIAVTRRNQMNAFHTEEIDVALWNDTDPLGLPFLPNIILVECKNWSARVSSNEVSWFLTKMRNRGQDFGILLAPNGITGVAEDLSAAHSLIAGAQAERRRLIVLNADDLRALTDTDQLILMIKEKLCDLAVKGTI
ncbi:restriction endonuclease [Rhizobium sp. Leaf391]|uniref:restriction endonuclease n=1 Tax=Rhizobium sp. Leaf391 TaxID=1736360 RepID=UPI000B07B41C|nr:restriction endonuclease [Rhizobium sp. Leaf391]